MVRFRLIFLITFFLTFVSFLSPRPTLALGCNLTIEPNSISKTQWKDSDGDDNKGGLIIKSTNCTFAKKGRTILIKRPNVNSKYWSTTKNYDTYDGKVLDDGSFITTDRNVHNLSKGTNYFALCRVSGASAESCNDNNDNYGNIYGEVTFEAGSVDPAPTNYQPPTIQRDLQAQCIYPVQSDIIIKVTSLEVNQQYIAWIDNGNGQTFTATSDSQDVSFLGSNFENPDTKRVCVDRDGMGKNVGADNCITLKFTLSPAGDTSCSATNPNLPNSIDPTPTPGLPACATFAGEGEDGSPRCVEVDTAFGRLNVDGPGIVQSLFGLMLGLGGLVAFILIVFSGFQLLTSQGNPEKIKLARERLTSAIVGLLFIIFSLVILQVIGVDILNLPSFSA